MVAPPACSCAGCLCAAAKSLSTSSTSSWLGFSPLLQTSPRHWSSLSTVPRTRASPLLVLPAQGACVEFSGKQKSNLFSSWSSKIERLVSRVQKLNVGRTGSLRLWDEALPVSARISASLHPGSSPLSTSLAPTPPMLPPPSPFPVLSVLP